LENSALLEERAKLEEKLKAIKLEKLKVETNLDEIKGNYEQEVTNLKIQLKNASLRVSKSKFCSTTNMNMEQTDPTQQPSGSKSKSQFPSGNESIHKTNNKVALERQDSFAKQSWSDIKDMLHAKEEAKSIRLNSVRSQSASASQQSRKPSSSSSDSGNDLENDLGSESSSQDKKKVPVNTSFIKKKSIRLSESVARPGVNVRSAQTLPGHIRSTATSPTRFVHQSMDEYRDRFEKANMTIDTLKCEIATLETRLKKKDEHIGEMKKELAMAKAQMTTKQAEKEALRGELVTVQQKLIVAQCDLDEVRKDKHNENNEEIPKLKNEIEKLREHVKVGLSSQGIGS
jgi:predicted  nucleic acid-binding Zn-ribbon protein